MKESKETSPLVDLQSKASIHSVASVNVTLHDVAALEALRTRGQAHEGPAVLYVRNVPLLDEKSLSERLMNRLSNILSPVSLLRRRTVPPAPGSGTAAALRFIFTKKSYELVLEPIVGDMQLDYIEALKTNRRWSRGWIRVRFALLLLWTIFWMLVANAEKVISLVKMGKIG